MRTQYHSVIMGNVPPGCERALDVGCGLGELTRRLRLLVPDVTGIDRDRRSIEHARAHPGADDVIYLHADVLDHDFPPRSFDMVTAVASLHHMDARAALERMRHLLRPGGVLAIVGLARASSPVDIVLTIPAAVGASLHRLAARPSRTTEVSDYHAPLCWPPPASYGQMRRLADELLPGARFRRHLYWRYSVVWRKPT